jgi:hypothetical protein
VHQFPISAQQGRGGTAVPKSTHFAEQMMKCRRFFAPGEVMFTFPQEKAPGTEMNPFYHYLEGKKTIVIDWMLSHEMFHLTTGLAFFHHLGRP